MNKLARSVSIFLSTCFYTSMIPAGIVQALPIQTLKTKKWTGAGFIGSLWGLLTVYLLPADVAHSWIVLICALLFSVWVSHYAEKAFNTHDDSRIVIDEWIGMWVALFGLSIHNPTVMISAFVFFRIFDVFKGPWGHALQKLPGGWGVCMDDVVAGVIANVLTRLVLFGIS